MASLYALRCVRELNFPMKHKVRLILGTAEETGCSDIEYYLKKESTPPMVFSPDGDYPILNTEKGQLRPDVTAHFAPCGPCPASAPLTAAWCLTPYRRRLKQWWKG